MKNTFSKIAFMLILCAVTVPVWAGTSYTLTVPRVEPGSVTIDGQLTENSWKDDAGTLNFGLGGITAGFDNELDYTIWGNTQYAHTPSQIIKIRHDGQGKLYVSLKSNDADIQGGTGAFMNWWDYQDADGMGSFVIKRKGESAYNGTTLTFFPPATNPQETVINAALGGTIHLGQARGTTWDWSFLPGNNTVNKSDDEDTGFIIEFVIDLTACGYSVTDTDITAGVMTANHDGPNSDGYPWSNSAFSRFQWSIGSYDADYGINHLILDSTLAVPVELSSFSGE